MTPVSASIAGGTSLQFNATGVRGNATTEDLTGQVTWTTSDEAIAIINADGLLNSLEPGTVTVTAGFENITGTVDITVTSVSLEGLVVTPSTTSIAKGTAVQLSSVGRFDDNSIQDLTGQVTWLSSDDSIATVDENGLVTSVNTGSVSISAGLGDVTSDSSITVTSAVLVSIQVSPTNPETVIVGYTHQFTARGLFSDRSYQDISAQVTWDSSYTGIATINVSGLATAAEGGTATISATDIAMGIVSTTTGGDAVLTAVDTPLVSIEIMPGTAGLDNNDTIQLTKRTSI